MCKKSFNIVGTGNILHIETADNFFKRFLGLMGRKKLPSGSALLITPCNSIHMMFMRFSIDAVYVDKNFKVLKIVRNLTPWLGLSMCLKAESVIEMNAGEADRLEINVGARLVEI